VTPKLHVLDNKRNLLLPLMRSLLCGALCLGPAAGYAADAKAGGETPGKIGFRQPQLALSSSPVAETAPAKSPALFTDAEDLSEKRQTLQGEVRYAKAKLEAAQKQLALQTAAGDLEKAGRIDEEVKDWQARYSSSKAQLDLIEKELSDSTKGSGQNTVGDEIVVPGENLEVFVNEDPSFNGIYQVRRGGYIIMPQVGRIAVAGKSLAAAEAAVKRALQSSQLQNASVMIERKQGADIENGPLVYLSGEFKSPRPWHIPSGVTPTLVNVILSSGGVTDKADLSRVKVMRIAASKGVVEEVNVSKILEGGGLTSDLTLGEGDVITIPAGPSNLVYVTGNVARQGSFTLKPGERVSAYGAILQNGGFARFADQRKVYVLRALPDGTKAKLPVDVAAIKSGHRPDVQLQSNDILVVPEKFWSF
jgi:protein involved in polysaccharide export with SLBB domain